MASTNESKIVAPYVPWETFTSFISHLRQTTVPGRIDKSAMPSNMPALVRGQMQTALRFLGLIGPEDTTQASLRELVDAYETDEWATVLGKIVDDRYASIVRGLDLNEATQHQLDERFESVGITGQMRLKSIRFYLLALTDANRSFSPHLSRRREGSQPRRRKSGISKKTKKKVAAKKTEQTGKGSDEHVMPPSGSVAYPIGPDGRQMTVPDDITLAEINVIEKLLPAMKIMAEQRNGGEE